MVVHLRYRLRIWAEEKINHCFGPRPLSRRWCDHHDRWLIGEAGNDA